MLLLLRGKLRLTRLGNWRTVLHCTTANPQLTDRKEAWQCKQVSIAHGVRMVITSAPHQLHIIPVLNPLLIGRKLSLTWGGGTETVSCCNANMILFQIQVNMIYSTQGIIKRIVELLSRIKID